MIDLSNIFGKRINFTSDFAGAVDKSSELIISSITIKEEDEEEE